MKGLFFISIIGLFTFFAYEPPGPVTEAAIRQIVVIAPTLPVNVSDPDKEIEEEEFGEVVEEVVYIADIGDMIEVEEEEILDEGSEETGEAEADEVIEDVEVVVEDEVFDMEETVEQEEKYVEPIIVENPELVLPEEEDADLEEEAPTTEEVNIIAELIQQGTE